MRSVIIKDMDGDLIIKVRQTKTGVDITHLKELNVLVLTRMDNGSWIKTKCNSRR